VKYHSYKLGTKELNICECGCHTGNPSLSDVEHVITNYLDRRDNREAEARLAEARERLVNRGFYLPTRTAHYLLTEAYIDEWPERWYQE
jgi:hypothetical protein